MTLAKKIIFFAGLFPSIRIGNVTHAFSRSSVHFELSWISGVRLQSSSTGQAPFQRLERILSNRGVGSRTEVSKLIRQGRVTVEGEVVKVAALKFPNDVMVTVDDEDVFSVPLLAIYNKPKGVHSTLGDPWGRTTLEDLYIDFPYLKTMHPVVGELALSFESTCILKKFILIGQVGCRYNWIIVVL